MAHTAANLVIHVIFSTKGRRAFIAPEIRDDLLAYLGGIVRELGGAALIINGKPVLPGKPDTASSP